MEKRNAKVPHQNLDFRPVHLTYRLAGSLPKAILNLLQEKQESAKRDLDLNSRKNPIILSSGVYKKKLFEINACFELEIDRALHLIKEGPFHLRDTRLARIIIDSWLFLQQQEDVYVCAVCVMGNHVHSVVRAPEDKEVVDIGKLMDRHKSHTARLCNRILGTIGTQFWEKFYFDRTVRQGKFDRVMWYVLNNPVKSGQIKDWRDWPGTYLNPDFDALYRNPG